MLKIQEIREIIKLIDQSDIEEFKYEHEGAKIVLKKNVHAPVQQVTSAPIAAQPTFVQQAPVQPVSAPEVAAPAAQPAAAEQSGVDNANLHTITSPMVGTFYQSSSPDSPPYVSSGSEVKADTVVCIVEAMKLFNEIEAEVEGEIVEVLAKDGQLVEYGQPLFLVKPR
ncbi:acetyl-CoA carboxylase biotin carboxyl carrier protein [Bacillus sp. FJAT-50079]|uniref:acetyl-CoA carboxylase biotin carboxyl carrier protein n=1 Tax=Bacillus sp. FJAT-50079 TaxID=2833577 RepID=UPI001BC93609|nr:acetyl-CoA carboxylase biotin carboxyl carrier protein [Bacillus sp. FJAT-50079]MBS4209640.1 acetyl-CoA carboxylase biotin carboxyl carrier protein [Bacillus sp. FJAT-50079]